MRPISNRLLHSRSRIVAYTPRDACSTAWRCRFLTARRCQHGRVLVKYYRAQRHWLIYALVRTSTTCDASSQTASAVALTSLSMCDTPGGCSVTRALPLAVA